MVGRAQHTVTMETPLCLGKVVDNYIEHNAWEFGSFVTPMACVHAGVTERLLLPIEKANC